MKVDFVKVQDWSLKVNSINDISHAEIKYDRNTDQYQVKSLRGSGCFLKIDKKIVRKNYNIKIIKNYFIYFKYSY